MGESLRAQAEPSAPAAPDRQYPDPAPAEPGHPAHDRLYPDPVPRDRRHHGRVHPRPEVKLPAGLKSNFFSTDLEGRRERTRGCFVTKTDVNTGG